MHSGDKSSKRWQSWISSTNDRIVQLFLWWQAETDAMLRGKRSLYSQVRASTFATAGSNAAAPVDARSELSNLAIPLRTPGFDTRPR
jgi:hypothetical protein